MNESTEKSPVDMLDEMYQMMKDLHQKMDILNKNMNILQNKTKTDLGSLDLPGVAKPSAPKNIQEELDQSQKRKGVPLQPTNTKVHGKIFNAEQKPVHGVTVKINDANQKTVKTTKTNMAGIWQSFLPPGKYSIKYTKEGMPPSYRICKIEPGQEEVEVI